MNFSYKVLGYNLLAIIATSKTMKIYSFCHIYLYLQMKLESERDKPIRQCGGTDKLIQQRDEL